MLTDQNLDKWPNLPGPCFNKTSDAVTLRTYTSLKSYDYTMRFIGYDSIETC